MGVKIKLNLAFQELAGSKERVEVDGATVKQCLDDVIQKYPRIQKWLFDKNGVLQSMVLMNGAAVSQEQLNQPVTEKDELWILNILEGG